MQGHRVGRGFCPSPCMTLHPWPETSQPGQTCCLLSLIAALCLSQSGSWLLPLHRIVSSHSPAPTGLTAFPLRLAAQLCLTGSALPLASQRHLLSLPPPIHSDFPLFSHHLTVLPYIIFCTEVQKAVGLRHGDTKVGRLLQRLPSIPFTLLSVLLGCRGPGCACLVGMRGARAQLDNAALCWRKQLCPAATTVCIR